MNTTNPKQNRVLAIAPDTRGVGFAVLEGENTLADWGVKTVAGDKNSGSVAKVEQLITDYDPEVLVLQDVESKDSRRSLRIRELSRILTALASSRNLKVARFPWIRVQKTMFAEGWGTKQQIAEIVAKIFPEELGFRLPPKRRLWESQDYRMSMFDAVALALTFRLRGKKAPADPPATV